MASSFSLDEKRFVLAEMIKCSTVDVEMLIRFVESNVSDPNWMTMQIPSGRNLEQCMQVANRSPTAPNHRSAMSQNDHLANSGMNHPRQIAPRTSPGGQTPGAMPMSPVNMPPWQPADGVEDRRAPSYEAPNAGPAPRKRGRPSRADRSTAVPPRLANIAPRPPQSASGSNTPRPILPAIQRPVDAAARSSQPPPPAHVPLLLDSPPTKKRRKTSAGAVSVSTPPPLPAITTPPASVDHEKRPRELSEANSTNVRENIREMGQVPSPRPMPLEPEPRHHASLMPSVASTAPSQIKA
ncbi:hypothetical protein ACHAPV_008044 [Trichoderma viride]